MPEFWEKAFQEKQKMWGESATLTATTTASHYAHLRFRNILIPGIGYGRNAKPFLDLGMEVTGIEVSETAIAMGKQIFGEIIKWVHGSVTSMPFDEVNYDGIFSHALIHLLTADERKKLIADCFGQLNGKGVMIFTAISKNSETYSDAQRNGIQVGPNWFKTKHGVDLFFYDEPSIVEEFGAFGLTESTIVDEPVKGRPDSTTAFWRIRCERGFSHKTG